MQYFLSSRASYILYKYCASKLKSIKAIVFNASRVALLQVEPEVGKILEILILEYDFAGTRTRTRTRE